METHSEERQQADDAVNYFMGPLVASLSSKVLMKLTLSS